ncbi:MAG: outer membrane beta-barrel domain-containing protein [Myxococcales bacterium]|nr:outer membrane beta-barrel domain-containing protein [Myxococcales bacterium]
MKRLIGTMVLAGAALMAAPAQAQEIQLRGPLAGARSVSRLVQYRLNRLAITPSVGITLQDEFSRDLFFGVRADYHLADWFGVGLGGAFAPVHIDTSLTDNIAGRAPGNTVNVPQRSAFAEQIGRRNFMVDLHATFIPLRGKFALFQSVTADVDLYLVGGVAFVGVEERADACLGTAMNQPSGCRQATMVNMRASQTNRASRVAIAPTFGFGLNFFLNRFVSLNLEYRATPFSWNRSGTDENSTLTTCGLAGNESCAGFSDYVSTYFSSNPRTIINADDRTLVFNQMVSLGVSIFLPTAPRIGR